MSDSSPALARRSERRRVRWATFLAVALDLLLPSLFAPDANRHDIGSRLAALTPFLTAGVGGLLWLFLSMSPLGLL